MAFPKATRLVAFPVLIKDTEARSAGNTDRPKVLATFATIFHSLAGERCVKTTSSNYQKDKLYPAVARAIAEIMQAGEVVSPVEVLLRTQRITKEQCEDWRFGRIPYLERVILGNLSKANRILRIIGFHARSLGLTPSQTEYRQWGKKGRNRRIVLRFSKSGDARIEAAYSTHYLTKTQRQKKQDKERREEERRAKRLVARERRIHETIGD